MTNLVGSILMQVMIRIFWFPTYLLRFGFTGALRRFACGVRFACAVEKWRRGRLPLVMRRSDGYARQLPSGKIARIGLGLIGGTIGLAFIELQVDGRRCGTFYVPSPAARNAARGEVSLDRAPVTPLDQVEKVLNDQLTLSDGSSAAHFIRQIATSIT